MRETDKNRKTPNGLLTNVADALARTLGHK